MCIECAGCDFQAFASSDGNSLAEHGFAGCKHGPVGFARAHSKPRECEKFIDAGVGVAQERREWIARKQAWIRKWLESSR